MNKLLLLSNILCFVLFNTPHYAVELGDEVIIASNKNSITVRSQASTKSNKKYYVSNGEKGIVLEGPVEANGYQWFLIDWDDSQWKKEKGWTAYMDGWYSPTGQTLIKNLTKAQALAELFFENRPSKLEATDNISVALRNTYKLHRENGFLSLDRANKNLNRSLKALKLNDYVTAYQEYKYTIVQLNNVKTQFNKAAEIQNN